MIPCPCRVSSLLPSDTEKILTMARSTGIPKDFQRILRDNWDYHFWDFQFSDFDFPDFDFQDFDIPDLYFIDLDILDFDFQDCDF